MKKIATLVLMQLLAISAYCQTSSKDTTQTADIWSEINESTWFQDNGFAGQSYVFYEDSLGLKRCVFQVHGSGFYVVFRDYVDMEITTDEKIIIGNAKYTLRESFLVSDSAVLKLFTKKPLIFNRTEIVDMEFVRSSRFDVRNINGRMRED